MDVAAKGSKKNFFLPLTHEVIVSMMTHKMRGVSVGTNLSQLNENENV